ncbi:MAG: hypothetical protein H6555_10820 [Lewinellaceae bacterium]|nr:hypothetical protein [Lewinellaceae bacterium]
MKKLLTLICLLPMLTYLSATCTDWYLVTYDIYTGYVYGEEYLYTTCNNEQTLGDDSIGGNGYFDMAMCSATSYLANTKVYREDFFGCNLDVNGRIAKDNGSWKAHMFFGSNDCPTVLELRNDHSFAFGFKERKEVVANYFGTLFSSQKVSFFPGGPTVNYYIHNYQYEKKYYVPSFYCWG